MSRKETIKLSKDVKKMLRTVHYTLDKPDDIITALVCGWRLLTDHNKERCVLSATCAGIPEPKKSYRVKYKPIPDTDERVLGSYDNDSVSVPKVIPLQKAGIGTSP